MKEGYTPLNLMIDPESPVPLYHQIAEAVRTQILTGQLKPGNLLPPDERISEQLQISRQTVLRAMSELSREGLLLRKRAIGTIVAPPQRVVPFVTGDLHSFSQEAHAQGYTLSSQILIQDIQPTTPEISAKLRLKAQDTIVVIRRLRSIQDGPIVLETSHFPYQRFPKLATINLTDRSIYEVLQQEYGVMPEEAVDIFEASPATAYESMMLGIEEGSPVMRSERIAMDDHGQVMEYTLSAFRADRFRYVSKRSRRIINGRGGQNED
jgi:GntR family transcriptional regulator